MFLEVVGFIVMVLAACWYTLMCYAMVCFGGLDLSPFWSKYYNSKCAWNRVIATFMCSACIVLWYVVLFKVSPFSLVME
jgi:hypothetical protein